MCGSPVLVGEEEGGKPSDQRPASRVSETARGLLWGRLRASGTQRTVAQEYSTQLLNWPTMTPNTSKIIGLRHDLDPVDPVVVRPTLLRFMAMWSVVIVAVGCGEPLESHADASPANDSAVDGETDVDPRGSDGRTGPPTLTCGRTELGEFLTGGKGRSAPLRFSVPVDARATTLTVQGPSDVYFNLAEWTLSNGVSVVPTGWLSLSTQPVACVDKCTNRVLAQPGAAAFLLPNTPLVKLVPGVTTVAVVAFRRPKVGSNTFEMSANVAFKVTVDTVCAADEGEPLRLAVNFGATGAGGWSAQHLLTQPRVAGALKFVTKVYAAAGIEIGPVNVFAAATETTIYTQDGPDAELTTLFRSGKGAPLGVNVFLVDKIHSAVKTGPGESLLSGVSGGLPGPPLAMGLDRSGIAVALHQQPGQPDTLGPTIAHEIGHFLGLFHTVEVPNSSGEMIRDNLNDTDDSATNLMHWSVGPNSKDVTEDQRFVLRNSPWLQSKP